jgi:putative aminopeptidase FrvX
MSFFIDIVKDEEGNLIATTSTPDQCPDKIKVSGHVDDGQVVDLTARVENFSVSGSRRQTPLY